MSNASEHLTITIPDAANVVIPNNGQTNEEIRRSLGGLYPQVLTAAVTREGCSVRFSRPTGGSKGA